MKNILASLSNEQAAIILKQLWDHGGDIRKSILAEAEKILCSVDVDEIARDILFTLDLIDVHKLWDRPGYSHDEYTSPEEMAYEMVEEELSPYLNQIDTYHKLGMHNEEKLYCMGVLKGLYFYKKEAKSEFRNWAVDIPVELFGSLLERWRKRTRAHQQKSEMDDFLRATCPDWAEQHCKSRK